MIFVRQIPPILRDSASMRVRSTLAFAGAAFATATPSRYTGTLLAFALTAGAAMPAYAESASEATRAETQSAAVSAPVVAAASAPAEAAAPSPETAAAPAPETPAAPAAPTGFWERSNLLGDMGGLRTWLGNYGVTLNIQETSELFGNFTGGSKRGLAYDGATQFGLNVDMEKALGIKGGQFFVDALQIHGRGITASHLGALQSVSGVEAEATTRLWELWYQQSLGDKLDVKVGQQSLDQEFIVSQYSATFVNATFGWPVLPAADMPAGGPAYPLSSLGVRLRFKPTNSLTVLGGVFDGNPAPGTGDVQKLNASGTTFNLHNGALLIGELQYAINQPPAEGSASPQASGLPGTYKIGFWYNNARFSDQHYDSGGVSLASPLSSGVPATHRGNWSVYAVADQMVWRPSPDSPRSLGVFTRAMGAPGDRNVVNFNVDAGVVLKAPFKGRDNDSVGLAVGYANIGASARAFDRDTAALTTPGYPVRSAETVVEATYQYQVAPWWLLQADFQYFFRPGGGIPNPTEGGARIGNEAVVGLRTVVTF
ncbi:carbohydrate porin [Trinickia symbiotica]|uniref:Carbohydrate porin n=2 Tax=Trinickia symbiotica TaxID=863227 RepID=A0A2T3Y1W0_9BURK|nr:carbohydrate porin [Trinickia symbiotica]